MDRFIIIATFCVCLFLAVASFFMSAWHSEFEYQTYKVTSLQDELRKHKIRIINLEDRPPIAVKSATMFVNDKEIVIQDNNRRKRK